MASRLSLQNELEELLGSRNVYFQPPASVRMNYPAIVYCRNNIENTFANNSVYKQNNSYSVTVIYTDPDSELPIKISRAFPSISFDRHYASDNLYHDIFTLYY